MSVASLSAETRALMRERIFAWMSADRGLILGLVADLGDGDVSSAENAEKAAALVARALGDKGAQARVRTREDVGALRRLIEDGEDGDSDTLQRVIGYVVELRELLESGGDGRDNGERKEVRAWYQRVAAEVMTVEAIAVVEKDWEEVRERESESGDMLNVEDMMETFECAVETVMIALNKAVPGCEVALRKREHELVRMVRGESSEELFTGKRSRVDVGVVQERFDSMRKLFSFECLRKSVLGFLKVANVDDCWLVHMWDLERKLSEGELVLRKPAAPVGAVHAPLATQSSLAADGGQVGGLSKNQVRIFREKDAIVSGDRELNLGSTAVEMRHVRMNAPVEAVPKNGEILTPAETRETRKRTEGGDILDRRDRRTEEIEEMTTDSWGKEDFIGGKPAEASYEDGSVVDSGDPNGGARDLSTQSSDKLAGRGASIAAAVEENAPKSDVPMMTRYPNHENTAGAAFTLDPLTSRVVGGLVRGDIPMPIRCRKARPDFPVIEKKRRRGAPCRKMNSEGDGYRDNLASRGHMRRRSNQNSDAIVNLVSDDDEDLQPKRGKRLGQRLSSLEQPVQPVPNKSPVRSSDSSYEGKGGFYKNPSARRVAGVDGFFSEEEDRNLVRLIEIYGFDDWSRIRKAGLDEGTIKRSRREDDLVQRAQKLAKEI